MGGSPRFYVITIEQARKCYPKNQCPSDKELEDLIESLYGFFDPLLDRFFEDIQVGEVYTESKHSGYERK